MRPTDEHNNCTKCVHSSESEIDANLKRQYHCLLNPPQSLAVSSPQGVQIITMFPQVNSGNQCSQGKMMPFVIN